MRFAIGLARRNVREGTGGPFGAAVFERATGRLLGAGVNLVTFAGCSLLHAEVVALALAQQAAGTYDLGAPGLPECQLVSTVDPCAMCLGAVPWSGVAELVCGAAEEDARGIGFDEGDKPADWEGALRARGLGVVRGLLREEARAVLQEYAAAGGVLYNGRAAARPREEPPR
jgi:tRNA(Arg) A34 adenosine deaminase TadA